MTKPHVASRLPLYVDGQLGAVAVAEVERHLAACDACRGALLEIRFAAGMLVQLRPVAAPDDIWRALAPSLATAPPPAIAWRPAWLFASLALAAALAALVGSTLWRPGAREWQVVHSSGASERLRAGELIVTDRAASATITVGTIGTVDVAPGTRVRLGMGGEREYRIGLEVGTISARISAPPRLFVVDTPSSTVVDLGCAYTMTVAPAGGGEIRVTEGWTALEWKGRESLVPAGAIADTRPGVGPGTPVFADASMRLREALTAFDFREGGDAALTVVLSEARVRDTLTLWHLLSRVGPAARRQVYDRIAALDPPPGFVARDRVLALDRAMLDRWRSELAWKW